MREAVVRWRGGCGRPVAREATIQFLPLPPADPPCSRQGDDGLCLRLAHKGYVAVTITYRLAPKYPFPAVVHDCKAAVRWLRANARQYHIDPERMGVTGGSAGGHLALFLGVTAGVKEF